MGPDDNVPDTMHLSGGTIVYNKAEGSISFYTATKAIVVTNLIGEVTSISKGSFAYHWNKGDEIGTYGSRKLSLTEQEKYIQPIIIEVEQME